MNKEEIARIVEQGMSDLGSIAEAVAGSLAVMDVYGKVCDPFRCPIAVYVRRLFADRFPITDDETYDTTPVIVSVNGDTIFITIRETGLGVDVPTTAAVQNFIRRFDSDEFPGLKSPTGSVR